MAEDGATTFTRPIAVRWEAWALLAAAAAAVAVGTIVRGFLGSDWYFNTENLANSTPLALPFLIAAGVVIGAGRWPAGALGARRRRRPARRSAAWPRSWPECCSRW